MPLAVADIYDGNAIMIDKQDADAWEMLWDPMVIEEQMLAAPKPSEYEDSEDRIKKILAYYKTFSKKPEERRKRLRIQSKNRWRRACELTPVHKQNV